MRLTAALASGTLVTLSIGLLQRHLLAAPHPISYNHLISSDTLYRKAWLASASVVPAVGRLLTAARGGLEPVPWWARLLRSSSAAPAGDSSCPAGHPALTPGRLPGVAGKLLHVCGSR